MCGLLVEQPPLAHLNQKAERLNHPTQCADGAFVLMDEKRRRADAALCRLRPLLIPPVDRQRPRQIRQQVYRAGTPVPQGAQRYRHALNSESAAAAATSSGDEPTGNSLSLIRAPDSYLVLGAVRRLRLTQHYVGLR